MGNELTPQQKAALQAYQQKKGGGVTPALPSANQISSSLTNDSQTTSSNSPQINYTTTPTYQGASPAPIPQSGPILSLEEYAAYAKTKEANQTPASTPIPASTRALASDSQESSSSMPVFSVPQQTIALEQGQNPFLQSSESNSYSAQYPTKPVLMSKETDLVSRGPAVPNQTLITDPAPEQKVNDNEALSNKIATGTANALRATPSPAIDPSDRFRYAAYFDPRPGIVVNQESYQDRLMGLQDKQNANIAQRGVEVSDLNTEQRNAEEQAMVLAKAQKIKDDNAIQAEVKHRMEAIDEYNASTIDPDRAWKEKGDMARIAGALAIGFGAFAQAYSGGRVPNTPLDIINRMIDRDIRAQEMDIEKKGRSIDIASNSLAMQRQLAGDNRAAELAERGRLIDVYKGRLANLLTKYDNANFQLEGVKTIEKMQAEKTQIADNLKLTLYKEHQRKLAAAEAAAAAREKENWERTYKTTGYNKDITVAEINNAGKAAERTVRIPSPTGHIQPYAVDTPDDAKIVKRFAGESLTLLGSYDALLKKLKDNKGYEWDAKTTADMKQHVANIDGILRSEQWLNTGVAMSEREIQMLQAFRPDDANSIDWLNRNEAILEGGRQIIADRYRNTMRVRVPNWDTATSTKTPPILPEQKE